MAALRETGVFRWSIPTVHGGDGRSMREQLTGSEAIAKSCLTTAFILSQREAAIRRILTGPIAMREQLLPEAADGNLFVTVGLSQLTTSRVHLGPALRATPTAKGYSLTGDIPWVSGADRAGIIVAGATLPDERQILVALRSKRPGVSIGLPMPLAALVGSRTAAVRCDDVLVNSEEVIAGPIEHVLGKTGGGGLETSCIALGLAGAAIEAIRDESKQRTELTDVATRFQANLDTVRDRLHSLAEGPANPDAVLELRVDGTRLALNATQACLLTTKGTGFVTPHPAQRWARQALFFLIWSCPRPVAGGVLEGLLPPVSA